MANQRYIRDSFWTDSYINRASAGKKLTFLYLLTNPLCNISGVYEIENNRIAFETGIPLEGIDKVMDELEKEGKIVRMGAWIVICNHIKHQSLGSSTAQGIKRELSLAPDEVQDLFDEITLQNNDGKEYTVPMYRGALQGADRPLLKVSKVKLSKVRSINNNNRVVAKSDDAGFDQFWDMYPKKVDKKKSKEKWNRLSIEDRAAILETLPSQVANDYGKRARRHVPNPTTYLNGEKWNDEVVDHMEPEKKPGKTISIIEG